MKLLNYTTFYFSIALFFVIGIWSVIFYVNMIDEVYDSLDDGLENTKINIVTKLEKDPALLFLSDINERHYRIEKVPVSRFPEDLYRDTLLFTENEKDYEPYRVLESYFTNQGQSYKLTVITSMVEEDDLIEDLFFSVIWLYFGLIGCVVLLNKVILTRTWQSFYSTLKQLTDFRIEKEDVFEAEKSKIAEFNLLNETLEQLLNRTTQVYRDQKQFIENASHELQTPLAITLNKLELLLKNNNLSEHEYGIIDSAINNLQRMSRLNSSLLLLSKIENHQFQNSVRVDLKGVLNNTLEQLEDFAAYKEVRVEVMNLENSEHYIHPDLAAILFTNLVKNAIIHNYKSGDVRVYLDETIFYIENTGVKEALPKEKLFDRFYKKGNSTSSTGLGLAIVRTIVTTSGYRLGYSFEDNRHRISIYFEKNKEG